mgnify:FL=1
MNRATEMYKHIETHGNDLKRIFNIEDIDSIELCKKLFRLENKAHQFATEHCNYGYSDQEFDAFEDEVLNKVAKILNCEKDIMFLNGDARGYALKFHTDFSRDKNMYRDWGGYGIVAPDFKSLLWLDVLKPES